MALVSKSDFAAIINVSPGRVSQFIKAGQISADAIVGAGQRAKIDVDRAKADLRLTLDISQRLGNGLDTRLDDPDPPALDLGNPFRPVPNVRLDLSRVPMPGVSAPPLSPATPSVDMELKQQKLEQARRANRIAAIEEAKSAGSLVESDEARAAMTRVAASMLVVFEGGLTDFASSIASEFKVPQRDVLHLLRRDFRKVREVAAKQARKEAADLPDTIETTLQAEDIETVG
ncbi:MAG TPA: hypothetical protein VFY63_08705 [Pseudorhizobium sp.]|nr:hypothetical protein [Pseudorhizobium sp.]